MAILLALSTGLVGVTASAEDEDEVGVRAHERLKQLRQGSLNTRRELHLSVLSSGIVSIVGGVALTIPDSLDSGLRYAGINTMLFGAINTIVGGVALYGISEERYIWEESFQARTRAERLRYREHALADESREAWAHALNLGLAGAYGAIGGMAIAVSRTDVGHPNRWLGSGIAISAQAVHLLVVDLTGTLTARCYERSMRAVAPIISYDPASGQSSALLSYTATF